MASTLPDYDDLPTRAGLRAAWGMWGEGNDVFGCLNLLTPDRVAAAAGLVRRGAVFALNWSMDLPDPPLFGRARFGHEVTGTGTGHDDVLHGWNTQSSSQWDGFRHIRNHAANATEPGTGHFGGVPDEEHGIHHWARRGIAGRAILADIARWREAAGRPIRHAESDAIDPAEIVECLAAQGTELAEGDILLVRTGWVEWYQHQPSDVRERLGDVAQLHAPGFASGEELGRTLWNLHIAAIGCDNPGVEVWPPSRLTRAAYEAAREEQLHLHEVFSHCALLPLLGLPLGEMWDLSALAADCESDGRYECFFTSAPLNLPAGVASPPNALAIK
ncbi:MAG: cyclase family protein [Ilumatobacteraceae bacterium]